MSDSSGHALIAGVGAVPRATGARARAAAASSLADWPRTTRLLPWTLAAFLAMLWLIPFDNTELPIPLPLDATLDRPMMFILIVVWFVSLAGLAGVSGFGAGPVHWAMVIFGLAAAASLILGFDTLNRLHEADTAVKKFALLISYGVLFVLAASSIRPAEVKRFTTLMVGLSVVMAIGLIVEYRTGFNAFYQWTGSFVSGVTPPEDIGRLDSIGRLTVVGPTGHPLAAAMMLSLALPFAVMGALTTPELRHKILFAIAAAVIIAGAAATQRKTSLVVPGVCLLVIFAYRPRQVLRYVPIALILGVLVVSIAPGALRGVADQLKPSAFTGVLTTKDRLSDYDAIKPEVVNRPLLGRGYESYDQKKYRILDNQYLTLAVNNGFVGIAAFLGILGTTFLLAHRCARSRDPDRARFGPAAAAACAGMAIGSGLLDTLALPQLPYLFCFIAALTSISALAMRGERRPAAGRPVALEPAGGAHAA